ncbi:MAG: YbhB/YbcL family Raf kinase inhibitor-like protein [Actinomycetota bacterium]|nr:YbhB/YbcL family Raf kinase inhibitor-like protein [Acidimicrobiia bacterium]MDQ3293608.1 YbhB/YbcL family Raf kinase inhibitor-like protein [Actinomycetota bacterium]
MAYGRLVGALLALVGLGLLAACDTDDGRALAAPAPGATAPPLGTSAEAEPGATSDNGVVIASSAFVNGAPIPQRYAPCPGENVSPPLDWTGIPTNVVELVIVMSDSDAPDGGFIHWIVTGLSPTLVGIAEGSVPEGAVEARNDTSEFGWYGPCPPVGETHQYVFTLYALTEATGIAPGTGAVDAVARITAIPGYAATLTGTYAVPA